MRILELQAENFKRVRVVEITPKGRLVQITGKNGEGKSSVIDAIWACLVGKRATPAKPVRRGAEKARIVIALGEDKVQLVVSRTIGPDGSQRLNVEKGRGNVITSPQQLLDSLLGTLSFDPLAFVGMGTKEQIEMLRQVAHVDIDFEEMNAANKADFDARTAVNKEIKRLEGEMALITVQLDLPAEKIDEAPILQQLNEAGSKNEAERAKDMKRLQLKADADRVGQALEADRLAERSAIHRVEELERQLQAARESVAAYQETVRVNDQRHKKALEVYEAAPVGEFVDVAALTQELQHAQLANREIDKRERRMFLEKKVKAEMRSAADLTRAMDQRNEKKAQALQSAKMPIDGLTFSENEVLFNGIPIEQLGEAEQLRISVRIAMAANPELRVLRIDHGEALDDNGMKLLADMAEENDFQIWVARVDSSGKVGIVMEDGMVKGVEA
jgi:recombinational DNA repair ATPase RecF